MKLHFKCWPCTIYMELSLNYSLDDGVTSQTCIITERVFKGEIPKCEDCNGIVKPGK